MTVYIDFEMDTKDGLKTTSLQSPFQDLGQTRDNLEERIDRVSSSSKSLMPVRDAETGDYAFINVMKLANIHVYEE